MLPPAPRWRGDLAQGVQGAQVLGADDRGAGEPLLEGGEDLDPLDGVDAEVGVQPHLQLQHLHRIAGLLADHGQEGLGDPVRVGRCRRAVQRWEAAAGAAMGAGTGVRCNCRLTGIGRLSPERRTGADSTLPPWMSRCCCSSRVWKVRAAVSCPSRKRRWSWAVSSCIFCRTAMLSRVTRSDSASDSRGTGGMVHADGPG